MASAATYSDRAQIVQNEMDFHLSPATTTPIFRPSSRRTPSFSSFSSFSSSSSSGSFSNNEDDNFITPRTPLRFSSRIPFSWEKLPGIPKQQEVSNDNKGSSQGSLLPLPPAGNNNTSSSLTKKNLEEISPKKSTSESFRKDPFFTALVECSKDDDDDHDYSNAVGGYWKGSKVTRTLTDRIGFVNVYTSCKRTCAVSESIVYLPRSRTYNLLRRR